MIVGMFDLPIIQAPEIATRGSDVENSQRNVRDRPCFIGHRLSSLHPWHFGLSVCFFVRRASRIPEV